MEKDTCKELFLNIRTSIASEAKHTLCIYQKQMKEWVSKPVHVATTNEGMGSKT